MDAGEHRGHRSLNLKFGGGVSSMGQHTSREAAWLHSIEAPMLRRTGGGSPSIRDIRICLDAAQSAVTEARRLLSATSPTRAPWKRYLDA